MTALRFWRVLMWSGVVAIPTFSALGVYLWMKGDRVAAEVMVLGIFAAGMVVFLARIEVRDARRRLWR